MTHKSFVLSTLAITLFTLAVAKTPAFAGDCVTQYGGSQYGTNCTPNDLVINKEVQKPGVKGTDGGPVFVENLSVMESSASAGTYMTFRLTVKNNSTQNFANVEVKDIFPPYMSYSSGGPSGTVYDPSTRTMTSTLTDLKAGESRQLYIVGKVEEANAFPAGKNNFCVVNTSQVRSEGRFDEDTAQVCLYAPSNRAASLPKAGFNDIFLIIPFALLGFGGFSLITKKA
jgi:uncharacterized repeat protein (TIGR01451 family)